VAEGDGAESSGHGRRYQTSTDPSISYLSLLYSSFISDSPFIYLVSLSFFTLPSPSLPFPFLPP
jgi:hypothetical protein